MKNKTTAEVLANMNAQEKILIRDLGLKMGWGRIMQLSEECWKEYADEKGYTGLQHTTGPCAAFMVPCHHPIKDESGHCDICCGAGRITKGVKALLDTVQAGEESTTANIKDMAILIRRLVHAIRNHTDDDSSARDLAVKALDYLRLNGLSGSPLREEYTEGQPEQPKPEVVTVDDLWAEWFDAKEEMDFYEWVVRKKCSNGVIVRGEK